MDVALTIVRGGGLAGVATCLELAATTAGPDEEELVAAASSALAEDAEVARPRPDELAYEVRLGPHVRRFREGTLPPPVRALVAWADAHPERRESLAGRPRA